MFLKYTPGNLNHIAKLASNFFTTSVLQFFMPELVKEVGHGKKIDFRCGFSKQFLDGKVDDTHISQVWFKKDNIVEGAFHFGCGILYNKKSVAANPLDFLNTIRSGDFGKVAESLTNLGGAEDWVSWRSFFLNIRGYTKFDFS